IISLICQLLTNRLAWVRLAGHFTILVSPLVARGRPPRLGRTPVGPARRNQEAQQVLDDGELDPRTPADGGRNESDRGRETTGDTGEAGRVTIAIADLRTEVAASVRVTRSQDTIDSYAEAMGAGNDLGTVVVFRDADGVNWLADGLHRVEAAGK